MKQNKFIKSHIIRTTTYFIFLFALLILFSCSENRKDGSPKPPNGYMNETTLKISAFFGGLELIETEVSVPNDIVEYKDIVYKTLDSTELKLDIYHAKSMSSSAPLLVFIHGGYWRKGDKQDYMPYLIPFAQKGYVTATVQYRFTDKATFPAQLLDIKSAIRWLKNNAEIYHIDSDKVALIGGSAGGHLALMSAYTNDITMYNEEEENKTSSRVQAIVDLYGPTDLTTDYTSTEPSVVQLIGKSYRESPELYSLASPLTYITKDDPPTLIFQGTIDDLVPDTQSDKLNIKLEETGVPVYYHKLKGWPHAMDLSVKVNEYCQYYMNQFFEEYIPINKK